MLAAMNGHTSAVRVLLDHGSDINAQIETNRNTALTLACFQGRHDVVNLLVDRKANIGKLIVDFHGLFGLSYKVFVLETSFHDGVFIS